MPHTLTALPLRSLAAPAYSGFKVLHTPHPVTSHQEHIRQCIYNDVGMLTGSIEHHQYGLLLFLQHFPEFLETRTKVITGHGSKAPDISTTSIHTLCYRSMPQIFGKFSSSNINMHLYNRSISNSIVHTNHQTVSFSAFQSIRIHMNSCQRTMSAEACLLKI